MKYLFNSRAVNLRLITDMLSPRSRWTLIVERIHRQLVCDWRLHCDLCELVESLKMLIFLYPLIDLYHQVSSRHIKSKLVEFCPDKFCLDVDILVVLARFSCDSDIIFLADFFEAFTIFSDFTQFLYMTRSCNTLQSTNQFGRRFCKKYFCENENQSYRISTICGSDNLTIHHFRYGKGLLHSLIALEWITKRDRYWKSEKSTLTEYSLRFRSNQDYYPIATWSMEEFLSLKFCLSISIEVFRRRSNSWIRAICPFRFRVHFNASSKANNNRKSVPLCVSP